MDILNKFKHSVEVNNYGTYSIKVVQHGKNIAEHHFRSNDCENLYSGSKTFVAIGVGIAEMEGLLNIDDLVLDYFPEYKKIASKGSETIRIEHLLQMCSGHVVEHFDKYNTMDRARLFFATEVVNQPGENFYYENLCSYMLGRIIEKKSGYNLLEYLKPRLFDKLDIINPQWHTCQLGHTACSSSLYLNTEEFSKVGILLLNKGIYNNQRIIPEDYVNRMTSRLVSTSAKEDIETKQGYGYQVWKCTIPNAYRADGMYGQFCIILYDYNAVITLMGHYEENPKDIIRKIWSDILPYLEK